jgi:GSH-dependent disulfide-bond oxidoreductase
MMGQALHFLKYAPQKVPYGIERYAKEVTRLFGVMNKQLTGRSYLAGEYSIADIASYPWILRWQDAGQNIADFPAIEAWLKRVGARPAVQKGMKVGAEASARQNA